MKRTAFVSAVALMLSSTSVFAGGEVGPVPVTPPAPAPVPAPVPGGVGVAPPAEVEGGIPYGAIAAGGLGAAAIACAILCFDDDDDDDDDEAPATPTTPSTPGTPGT